MYDVAISFAAQDRELAERMAILARELGLSVFYDDFERSGLWGRDLAEHLDTVYRKEALFCIVIVSKHYVERMWTRHEIRSVLARAMESRDEYLLPVRVDDTDLPGLSPVIGYLDARIVGAPEIVRLLGDKLGVRADSSFRHTENLLKFGQKSRIPCVAFVIDRRYVTDEEYDDGWEFRLAVSFGENITGPENFGTILAPPVLNGRYVLALHCIATRGEVLGVCDMWYDARAYESDLSQVAAVAAASAWLAEFSDVDYARHAADDSILTRRLYRSVSVKLGDFEYQPGLF